MNSELPYAAFDPPLSTADADADADDCFALEALVKGSTLDAYMDNVVRGVLPAGVHLFQAQFSAAHLLKVGCAESSAAVKPCTTVIIILGYSTHYSTLIVDRRDLVTGPTATVFDSSPMSSTSERTINVGYALVGIASAWGIDVADIRTAERQVPQQKSGSNDCGIHCLTNICNVLATDFKVACNFPDLFAGGGTELSTGRRIANRATFRLACEREPAAGARRAREDVANTGPRVPT